MLYLVPAMRQTEGGSPARWSPVAKDHSGKRDEAASVGEQRPQRWEDLNGEVRTCQPCHHSTDDHVRISI